MEGSVSPEVRQFVEKYIRSLDQLEVLLLVSALPDREWSVTDVYNVVRSSPGAVEERLEFFTAAGVFHRTDNPPTYWFQPRTVEIARVISSLSAAYKLSRHRVVAFIYSPARVDDPMTSFSDAFRFKKKD